MACGILVESAGRVDRLRRPMAGAPELEHEDIFATWLTLGGATLSKTGAACRLWWRQGRPRHFSTTSATSPRRFRLHRSPPPWHSAEGVRLRVRQLEPGEVTFAHGVPTLTVERAIADLVEQWVDRSLVADVVRDAIVKGKLVSAPKLASYLVPAAAANGYGIDKGEGFVTDLVRLAGVEPVGRGSRG